MSNPFNPRFRVAYRKWKMHDLGFREGSIRPWFYENLREEDEPLVWEFIEENYLSKYENLVGVRFEWSAEGLWRIPFPGSVGYGDYLQPSDLSLPANVIRKLTEWHDDLDALEPGMEEDEDDFDHEASNKKGLSAAKEVKLFLGEDCYVEFQPFQEITLVDGVPVELRVPKLILSLGSNNNA